jgi:hypothetical protein
VKTVPRFTAIAVGILTAALLLTGCAGIQPTTQANQHWANTACTSVLAWKKSLHHDETSLSLKFGPSARLKNAVVATRRLADQLSRLGLPTGRTAGHTGKYSAKHASDLEQIANLGLAMLETKACRQLGGGTFS